MLGVTRLTGGLSRALKSVQKIAEDDRAEVIHCDGNGEIGKHLFLVNFKVSLRPSRARDYQNAQFRRHW